MNVIPNIALLYHEGNPANYLAAIVRYEADNHEDALEEIFELTNHIDHDWRTNEGVIATNIGLNRSTSVGDFIQLGAHLYRCDPNGWTHVAPTMWQLIQSLFIR